jgi:hypothetical protein
VVLLFLVLLCTVTMLLLPFATKEGGTMQADKHELLLRNAMLHIVFNAQLLVVLHLGV